MLTAAAIDARNPERHAQELLDEWLKRYFTGTPHTSALGDVTFPLAAILFNQTQLPHPDDKAQIHVVFAPLKMVETHDRRGHTGTWSRTLASPASGVGYGQSTDGFIEETVHGAVIRRERGTDLRWRNAAGTLYEEIFRDGGWTALRTWAGAGAATSPSWTRSGTAASAANAWRSTGNYVEKVNGSTVRTITPGDATWDGGRRLLSGPLRFQVYVRQTQSASGQRDEFACRAAAAAFFELVHSKERYLLAQKGMRNLRIESGPVPLAAPGVQVRMLDCTADLFAWVPRE